MNSIQESTNELNAAIRYAENAITSAKQTIESMQFRQDMAKKQHTEQTGREQALEAENAKLREHKERLTGLEIQLRDKIQGQYDDIVMLEREVADIKERLKMETAALERLRKDTPTMLEGDENERLKREVAELNKHVEFYTKKYNELAQQKDAPTMPVIPKAVAIAIFREGVEHGVSNACDELDNSTDIHIEESGYSGGFEVSFTKYIDLSEHLDLDWMRDKVGDYDEASVIEALKSLCAEKKFECRIHGVDDNPTNND